MKKKQNKLINASVITRHNAIVISCDEQLQISSFSLFKNFAINQEKHVDKVLKKFVESKSMKEKTRKSLKPVGTRSDIMYGSYKVHKASVGNCPPF